MREAVVLVHGIWMTGLDLVPLRHRLRGDGFEVSIFRYPSLTQSPAQNADRLATFLEDVEADVVHLVGHSLGGVVLLHLFARHPVEKAGRAVLLGSPVNGSAVARILSGRRFTRPLIGRSGEDGLLGGSPAWSGDRELGVIAGDQALGVGRVLGGMPGPSDGTVAVAETRLPGAADHITLPVTHSGLVFSRAVFEQVAWFLRHGRFAPGGANGEVPDAE